MSNRSATYKTLTIMVGLVTLVAFSAIISNRSGDSTEIVTVRGSLDDRAQETTTTRLPPTSDIRAKRPADSFDLSAPLTATSEPNASESESAASDHDPKANKTTAIRSVPDHSATERVPIETTKTEPPNAGAKNSASVSPSTGATSQATKRSAPNQRNTSPTSDTSKPVPPNINPARNNEPTRTSGDGSDSVVSSAPGTSDSTTTTAETKKATSKATTPQSGPAISKPIVAAPETSRTTTRATTPTTEKPAPTGNQEPTPANTAKGATFTYGNAQAPLALQNTLLSTDRVTGYSNRVIFDQSGTIQSVTKYHMFNPTPDGYRIGDGGIVEYRLETDDNTTDHRPSGTTLATTGPIVGAPGQFTGNTSGIQTTTSNEHHWFHTVEFKKPVNVKAGVIYHLTITNIAPDPKNNAVSINDWIAPQGATKTTHLPTQNNLNWSVLHKTDKGWATKPNYWMLATFNYTDGTSYGNSYFEIAAPNKTNRVQTVSNNKQIRQTFRYNQPKAELRSITIRAARVAGQNPLTLTIHNQNGQQIATEQLQDLPTKTKTSDYTTAYNNAHFATATIPPGTTLEPNNQYYLTLTTTGNSEYHIPGTRDGATAGYFKNNTAFTDGNAQTKTNNNNWTNWTSWGNTTNTIDLNFYLTLQKH